jgi:hypothetical protein
MREEKNENENENEGISKGDIQRSQKKTKNKQMNGRK